MNGVVLKMICIQGIQYPSVSSDLFLPRRRIYPGEAFRRSRGCRIWHYKYGQSVKISQSVQLTLKFSSFINSVPYGGFISSGMVWQGYCFHCVITTDGHSFGWLIGLWPHYNLPGRCRKKDSWLLVSHSLSQSVTAAWRPSTGWAAAHTEWPLSQSDWA